MTLLIVLFAAILCTVLWYRKAPQDEMKVGMLCWMYWGASLMWMVDGVFAYIQDGADFFTPAPAALLNDGFLGLCVVALGLVVWLATLLVKDPKGAVRAALLQKRK